MEIYIYKTIAERRSMEIGARVNAECMITGKIIHVGSAYLTFVKIFLWRVTA